MTPGTGTPPSLPGANKPNPPPLVDPTAPHTNPPDSWYDPIRIMVGVLDVLASGGPEAAQSLLDWINAHRK